jgi:hypothetical protein
MIGPAGGDDVSGAGNPPDVGGALPPDGGNVNPPEGRLGGGTADESETDCIITAWRTGLDCNGAVCVATWAWASELREGRERFGDETAIPASLR